MDFLEELPAKKSKDEIARLSKRDLDNYVKECSTRIIKSIHESEKKLDDAKTDAEYANNLKPGIFGKSKEKLNATSEAVVSLQKATNEIVSLQRETIQFICVSVAFAQKMNKSISHMIEDGFKDSYGQVQHLTDGSKKIARKIVEESQKYAQNQLEQQKKDLAQDKHLNKLEGKITHISELNNQHEQKLQEHDKKFLEKDELDEEQSHNISVLKATLNRLKEDELSHITDLNSKIFNVDEKIKKLQTSLDSHIEVERKSEEIESEIKNSIENLPPDFREDFSKYAQENKTSIQEIDEKLNDFKIKAVNQISEIESGLRKSLSDLDSKFREIKPASKFPLVAGIIAIVLGVGAFVSVFLPLKLYIEQENAVINTRLTNYIKDNNESLKNELNGKFDSITGNENQISLLANQLNELKADYQKSIDENKAILSESEAKITALSEKIEEQNKEIFSLNEKISAYEKKAKDESVKIGQQTENLNSETNADAEETKLPEPESSSIQLENTARSQIKNQAGENENLIPENSGAETENTGDLLESQSNGNNNSEIQVSDKSDYDSKNENLDSSKNIEKPKPNLFLRILKIVGIVVGSIILLGIILIIIGTKLG